MKIASAFLAAALLAGPSPALDKQPTAKMFSDRLAALPQIKRFAALRRAVLDFGPPCRKVLAAGYQGPWKNLEMWVVRCGARPPLDQPKRAMPPLDYAAFIGPDGSVQVSSCADMAKVNLPACRKL